EFGTWACIPTRCSISTAADAFRRRSKCCRSSSARFSARWLRTSPGIVAGWAWRGPFGDVASDEDQDEGGQLDRGRAAQPKGDRHHRERRHQQPDAHEPDLYEPAENGHAG